MNESYLKKIKEGILNRKKKEINLKRITLNLKIKDFLYYVIICN